MIFFRACKAVIYGLSVLARRLSVVSRSFLHLKRPALFAGLFDMFSLHMCLDT